MLAIATAGATVVWPAVASARPEAPLLVCATYPDSSACAGRLPRCETCHTSTAPAAWNAYGLEILGRLDGPFEESLGGALAGADLLDSDGDGLLNGDELRAGSNPGDALDGAEVCPSEDRGPGADGLDEERAFRRVSVLYCGRSPAHDALEAFRALPATDQPAAVDATLDACLASGHWRDEGLARIADPLIRPVYAVGIDSPIDIPLADYDYDYRLFSWVCTGGRDARELLTADYHVRRGDDGHLEPVFGALPGYGKQPLEPEHRAGMITTQWFLVINTMFSALPRTTAAHAYRSYLGYDISFQQGLFPAAGEPRDVDDKGVKEESCAVCHATLDPLSYGFASYGGIDLDTFLHGIYDPERPAREIPGWSDPEGALFGEPVADVVAWARVAADSDAFARTVASMFYQHALGRPPEPAELPELDEVWRGFVADRWSVDALIHRIADTRAFRGGVL